LEGLEKDVKPSPEPNWLGCATAVVSSGAAVVNGLEVAVRTAAVLVLEYVDVSEVAAIHKNGNKRTRWLRWWR